MMQADSNNFGDHQSAGDDSFEQKPLLPQHQQHHAEALRSRRGNRHGAGPGHPLSHTTTYQNNADTAKSPSSLDDGKYRSNFYYPNTTNGGRPGINKIKSIARIGRSSSASINQSFDDAVYNNDEGAKKDEYYYDDTNDFSWDCTFGTQENHGIWLNTKDPPGYIMSILVWVLIFYSGITIAFLAESNHIAHILAYVYCTICALALASHAKTSFSDPGTVPSCAVPINLAARQSEKHFMCGSCSSYKPPMSHHCRICNRCVSRMDHHCPWMNNCIGAANLKPFILFLGYTWIGSALALIIFGCNYFLCSEKSCEFDGVLVQLVRFMTILCIGSILFTSSMLANVVFGVMTGEGTIDRLKRQIANTLDQADEPPLKLEDVFGIGHWVTWLLPVDPIFPDHDRVLGFSVPQRLLREGNENTPIC
mmetsp:Transcript_26604/g.56215  ORF Transcript_26604/g.56215 Transcript_26604/m.56215 type:complete len:422 (-) Transcript_26604:94-1359(-)